MSSTRRAFGDLVARQRRRHVPVAQHGHGVGIRGDLLEPMAHEQHGVAVVGASTERGPHRARVLRRQGRGRLVEHEQEPATRIGVLQRAGDREQGAVGGAERAHRRLRPRVDPEARQHVVGRGAATCATRSCPPTWCRSPHRWRGSRRRTGRESRWDPGARSAARRRAPTPGVVRPPSISDARTVSRPRSARCTPPRILISVDLPEPLPPMSAWI